MKKKLLSILLVGMLLLPIGVKAAEYESMNLEETLTEEEIEHDLGSYKETDKQVPIYMFRGSGCSHCRDFLTFLNSIVPEYGDYFKLVSYEVWNNEENSQLMSKVAKFLDENASGVPFIVIGDQTFLGYGDSFADGIKSAIKKAYDSKDRYDVFAEMEKHEKAEKKNTNGSSTAVILWNAGITLVAVSVVLYFNNKKYNELNDKLTTIDKKMKKEEKGKK